MILRAQMFRISSMNILLIVLIDKLLLLRILTLRNSEAALRAFFLVRTRITEDMVFSLCKNLFIKLA